MTRALAHLALLAALGFGVLSQNAPHVSAEPAATPPVGDTGPVDWGDPTPAAAQHAPSATGHTYLRVPATQAARDWAWRRLGTHQWLCLDKLWHAESGWRVEAYGGIPQARPPSKMSSAGRDWRTNPLTQVRWGLVYVGGRYGSPCSAWSHKQRTGWY